jgi:hypothetical protein
VQIQLQRERVLEDLISERIMKQKSLLGDVVFEQKRLIVETMVWQLKHLIKTWMEHWEICRWFS